MESDVENWQRDDEKIEVWWSQGEGTEDHKNKLPMHTSINIKNESI